MIVLIVVRMEEYVSGSKAGAGNGNASTRSALCSQSSPQMQGLLAAAAADSLSSIFATSLTPLSLSAAISTYLSIDASSSTSKEYAQHDNARSIHCTPLQISHLINDAKRKAGRECHEERPTNRETKNWHQFAGASGHGTNLAHLQLGDTGTLADMRPAKDNQSNIDHLQVHDYAFVLRSRDKSWTYAIIADWSMDRILFAVDKKGSIKTLLRKHWLTCMRLVNINEDRSATTFLPAPHTSLPTPTLVSTLKSLDCRDQMFPPQSFFPPFTDTDYQG
jgi:hypothetical protein